MTTTNSETRTIRTYGGWRQTRGIGLFGVGPAGTLVAVSCVVIPLLLASVSMTAFLVSLVPAAAVVAVTLTRSGGMTIAGSAGAMPGWVVRGTCGRPNPRRPRCLPGWPMKVR